MKAEFLTENLETLLPILGKILPVHSQIPVLANLLIEANTEGISISSTNLETGVRITIPAKVSEEGAITVPGKQFIEAVSTLPKDKVVINSEKGSFKMTCRDIEVSFQTIAKEEFPGIFEELGDEIVTFTEEELRNTFSALIFATSIDDARPELTGILVSQKDKEVDFVATDGFRLSLNKIKNKNVAGLDSMILPSKLIAEAISLKSPVTLFVYSKANQIIIKSENVILVGRVISGHFPNYDRVIPKEGKTTISFDASDFSQKLRLASIFARDTANVVKVKIEDGKIKMHAESAGVGAGEIELEGKQDGGANEIAFNIKFLSDFLKNVDAKEITMQVSSAVEPALFRIDTSPTYIHVIMPVRVEE